MLNPARDDPLFDLASYARRGPGHRDHLTPRQIAQIARTVSRAPEVMIKVLPRSANDPTAVQKHLDYIGRKGEVDLETDDGEILSGKGVGEDLIEDWDLELDQHRARSDLLATSAKPPRLVHKLIFSMPAGTPPDKVLTAVRNFLREEFALKHRYVMTLHTDEPHPHVHVVLKAVSEHGQRLHIRKATLRAWRAEFAWHLRDLGVTANATQRYVRGETKPQKSDGIYRASVRGESTHMRDRAEAVGRELAKGGLSVEPGKSRLLHTRKEVVRGWREVSDLLLRTGQSELAANVTQFVTEMPRPQTEREMLAATLMRARESVIKSTQMQR